MAVGKVVVLVSGITRSAGPSLGSPSKMRAATVSPLRTLFGDAAECQIDDDLLNAEWFITRQALVD